MEGRKLPSTMENPIDNLIYKYLVEPITPILREKFNMVPDNVTFFRLLFGIISLYYIYYGQYIYGAILWGIAYVFDCIDGYMARKYQIFSKYGDYYDHFSDYSTFIVLLIILHLKDKGLLIAIILLFMLFTASHMGCQEKKYNNKKESPTLNSIDTCYDVNDIKYTRYLGCGTLEIVIILCILSMRLS